MAAPSRSNYGMGTYTPSQSLQPSQQQNPSQMGQYGMAGAQAGIGSLKVYGTLRAGRERQAMMKRNAAIVEQDAKSQALAMEEGGRRLAQDQRGMKATQRMSVASRGGLMGGTDLLTLADEAEKMQLDQLEIMRQRDIGLEKAKYQARVLKYQGKMAKYQSRWTAAIGLGKDLVGAASTGMG
jgi:hypothetical protein